MPQTKEKLAFLRETASQFPEYKEIMPLFLELHGAIEGREGETGISFGQPHNHAAERIAGGLPLLTPELMQVDQAKAALFVAIVIDAVMPGVQEGAEELALLRRAVAAGELELQPLFAACMSRERKPLDNAAALLGIPSTLLTFILEPVLKTGLESFSEGVSPSQTEGWQEGYCPVCGSRDGMGELTGEEGKRHLCCSTCFYKWPYKRMKCPYCGNEETESLSYFLVGEAPTRVDICHKCSRYLKTRDSRKGHGDIPIDAEDLATIHLDLLAGKEGFERGI